MKKLIVVLSLMALFVALMGLSVLASAPPGPFFNGFEKNTNGWFDLSNGGFGGHIARQPSGYTNGGGYANGINSAAGHWHARLSGDPCFSGPNPLDPGLSEDCAGPNTNWGGYSSTFPPGGYLTQVDIYLDVSWAASNNDVRFDLSSAINDNTGAFRRDFVFNVGTQLPLQSPHFIIQSSTNAFRSGANPNSPCPSPSAPPNSCRPPVIITASGWYTFRHTFHDDGSGYLAIDFDIFPLGSNVPIMHQTIDSNPFDPMSMVGGNRYGWFANEEIADLAIDNSLRTGLCHEADGDGDVEGKDSHKGHMHFHRNTCDGSNDDVEEDDDNSGDHFQSTSTDSATFTPDDNSQTVTMIGTGLHNGLPVGFTMIAVDNQGLAPAVFTLILTDGYSITGNVTSGSIVVQ
jgi:hypothetical protein